MATGETSVGSMPSSPAQSAQSAAKSPSRQSTTSSTDCPPENKTPGVTRVASEFARQYYSILNECPGQLHRFYLADSEFIHGGIDSLTPTKIARGQQAIHDAVVALNFKDCMTKINYIDAQGSQDGAILVQLAGHLSNSGGPMRRFLQTVMLCRLAPSKFYVRNDIFRYQDELFYVDQESSDTAAATQGSDRADTTTSKRRRVPRKQSDSRNGTAGGDVATNGSRHSESPPKSDSDRPPNPSRPRRKRNKSISTSNIPANDSPSRGNVSASSQAVSTSPELSSRPRSAQDSLGGTISQDSGGPDSGKDRSTRRPPMNGNRRPGGQGGGRQLYINEIPSSVTDEQLISMLERFGTITDSHFVHSRNPNLVKNPQFQAKFAFVTFSTAEEAKKVIDNQGDLGRTPNGDILKLQVEPKKTHAGDRGGLRGPRRDGPTEFRRPPFGGSAIPRRMFPRNDDRPLRG